MKAHYSFERDRIGVPTECEFGTDTVNKYISAELDRGLVNSRVISGRPSKTREVTADVTDLRAQLVVPFAGQHPKQSWFVL